jgi:hypothetical protein
MLRGAGGFFSRAIGIVIFLIIPYSDSRRQRKKGGTEVPPFHQGISAYDKRKIRKES